MSEDTKKIIYSMVGVNKNYNGKPIIKDISLSYFYGAKIGVLGLNGSGKSTLSYVLAGKEDYEVTDGSVTWKGEDLLDMEPDERAVQGPALEEQRRLRDLDAYIASLVTSETRDMPAQLDDELRILARERQALLEKAIDADDLYLRKLGELESAQLRLSDQVKGFDEFMAVHLLWVRSSSPADLAGQRLIGPRVAVTRAFDERLIRQCLP